MLDPDIIEDIVQDATALSAALTARDFAPEQVARMTAASMPAIIRFEASVLRYAPSR